MKNKFKFGIMLVALFAMALTAVAGLGDPEAILSYTGGNGYYFSRYGTNDDVGYTNTAKYVDLHRGTTVTYGVHFQGFSANFSNNVTLSVKPAFSSAANDVATQGVRYAIVPNGNTALTTNIVVTGFGAPGAMITFENPADNPVSITNLTVKVTVKSP